MDPHRGKQIVTPLISMFLEESTRNGRRQVLDLQESLLSRYGCDTIRLLQWGDARMLDQRYFSTGGIHMRAFYGWPQIGDVVSIFGVDMIVTTMGLLTFQARALRIDEESEHESETKSEDEGDRL